ncbi:MAG: hypothetical protein GX785_07900 [Armatimonadetes bacterium]|nr:hypothetical protein [Armatimonadota bacterium]
MKQRGILVLLACLLIFPSVCRAHWLDHQELPEWARRGYCQWGHGANINGRIHWTENGYGVDLPNIHLIRYCGRNLMQTITYLDEEARRVGESAGVRRQPYICSKTIWWRNEFPKAPQLERCTILKPDGTRVLLYNNPERYGGCYSSPIWLDYVKQRVDSLLAKPGGEVHSIFFDNCMNYDCHCAECHARFKEYTREKFGREMALSPSDKSPDYLFARRMFDADEAVRFFQEIRRHLNTRHREGILISPNIGIGYGWSSYLVNRGATDLVFIEEGFTFPPFESTVLKYKLGLAASHGKTVGQLLGLPQGLRRQRALALDEKHEMGILEAFVYPEEHKLALAEAMATNGTNCVSFALREQKITANDAPYQVQNREAIHQYSAFHQRHLPLFDRAQPAARVAVVHAVVTELGRYNTRTALQQATRALERAGVPYEVLVEEDLEPEQLRHYRLLILPEVYCLNRERCQALEEWLKRGGALVQLGSLAQADELGRAYPAGRLPLVGHLAEADPAEIGAGRVWLPSRSLDEMPARTFLAELQRLAGPLERAETRSPRLFCNLLRSRDGKSLTAHLVNSDFSYTLPPTGDIQDDDGLPEARTFLSTPAARIRKVLRVPEPAKARDLYLKFVSATCGVATDAFSLVVTFNGQEIATIPGSWLNDGPGEGIPVPPGLIREENEVVFRVTGRPNSHPDWVAFHVDTNATSRRSWWSGDGGKSWTQEDLSPDPGTQQGEVMVRLGPRDDPERVATPEEFEGRLRVNPARDIDLYLNAGARPPVAVFRTPEGVERRITPRVRGGMAIYRVPEVPIYGLLILNGA